MSIKMKKQKNTLRTSVSSVEKNPVGRPSTYREVLCTILVKDIKFAQELNDSSRAIACAVERAFSKVKVVRVLTRDVLQKMNPQAFNMYNAVQTISLDGKHVRFTWELNNFTEFFFKEKYPTQDFSFTLSVPKEWGI